MTKTLSKEISAPYIVHVPLLVNPKVIVLAVWYWVETLYVSVLIGTELVMDIIPKREIMPIVRETIVAIGETKTKTQRVVSMTSSTASGRLTGSHPQLQLWNLLILRVFVSFFILIMSKHQKPSIPVAASPQSNNSNNTNGTPKVKKGFMKAITGPYIVHVAVPAILSLHVCLRKF